MGRIPDTNDEFLANSAKQVAKASWHRRFLQPARCGKKGKVDFVWFSGQILTTSAEVTQNGSLIRELPQNPLNSGLGIILICPGFCFNEQLSNEKNLGWWDYFRGWNTTQLYRDYFINHEIRIPINQLAGASWWLVLSFNEFKWASKM